MSIAPRSLGWETRDALDIMRHWYRRPRAWFISALALSVIALGLGWSWLAAIGALPVILSALPCLAMCALGLCMSGMRGQSCSTSAPNTVDDRTSTVATPTISPPPEKEDIHA